MARQQVFTGKLKVLQHKVQTMAEEKEKTSQEKLEEYLAKYDWLWEDNTPLYPQKKVIQQSQEKQR